MHKDVAICGVVLPRPMPITGVNEIWSAAYTWGSIQIQPPHTKIPFFIFIFEHFGFSRLWPTPLMDL